MSKSQIPIAPSAEHVPERAKHLSPSAPEPRASPPAHVPARMVNEVLYCERLMHIEWVQGDFADNAFTVEGRLVHRRADRASGKLPPAKQPSSARGPLDDGASRRSNLRTEGARTTEAEERAADADGAQDEEDDDLDAGPPPYTARSVWLTSDALGLTAKIDIVEGTDAGAVVPIEYKRGKAPELAEGAYLPERAQLCAQAMLLRDHGYRCHEAAVYFAGSRRRVPIAIDDALVSTTRAAIRRAREIAEAPEPPPPLVDDPRCNGCSLVGICLPDETNLLKRLADEPMSDADPSFGARAADDDPSQRVTRVAPATEGAPGSLEAAPLRRLHPARDDRLPLYVQEQGARISLSAEELVVKAKKGGTAARLAHTSQVCLLGNVQVSTQAIRAMIERGIPLCFFSYGGWYLGRATSDGSKNIALRIAQHRAAADDALCLRMARGFVSSKIKNCRTLLRRNHTDPRETALGELEVLARKAAEADSLPSLLGLEGTAARVYFGEFTGMLKGDEATRGEFDLDGRNRRPPRDPVNALLSYSYALLAKDFVVTLASVGLEPLLGFYHQPRFGRPALALDLMEEFRPLVADSVVVGVINTAVVTGSDFTRAGASVALAPAARRRVLQAYERRMDQLITHPLFGYRISYRRVLEVQARLLARMLLGEIDSYPAFRTR